MNNRFEKSDTNKFGVFTFFFLFFFLDKNYVWACGDFHVCVLRVGVRLECVDEGYEQVGSHNEREY